MAEKISGVDFLSELPFDVVEHVLSFVDVSDALKCLRVCKRWHSLLNSSTLELYWKSVCLKQLGLTKARLTDYQRHCTLVKIASSALRHHKWVGGFMSKIDKLDKGKGSVKCHVSTAELFRHPGRMMNYYPQNHLTPPSCFIGHNFILCSPLFFREPHLTVATVSPMTKTIFSSSLDPLRTCLENPRRSLVFWAKASVNYILFLIQPEGRWIGYCPVGAKIVLDVKDQAAKVLLTGGCVAIASCERCFQIVTFKAMYEEAATWDLTVLKMGKPCNDDVVMRESSVVCQKSMVVKLKANETIVGWKFLSLNQSKEGSPVATSVHYCSSHLLVCITNTKISIYKCTSNYSDMMNERTSSEVTQNSAKMQCEDFVVIKVGEIVIPDSPHHSLNPDTGLLQISSVQSSIDGSLLAMVVNPSQLYVWDLHSQELITTKNLSNLGPGAVLQDPQHSCRLLAVGHHYTVVAVFDDKPGGQICIIATAGGEVLTRRDSRVQWRVHRDKDYIHLVNEEWLSDIFCFNVPFFTYLNKSTALGSSVQTLSCVQFLHRSQMRSIT